MMKRLFAATLLLTLILSACSIPATPEPPITPTQTEMPSPTETPQPIATASPTIVVESELPYDQQKQLIEARFERGSQAFEAIIKEDGNLEYYDGTWKTLEAMRNLNGEIIPWGESYNMISEEGRNGILTNIMAGNEALMEKHTELFDNRKIKAEEKGFDSSNFDVLYVQFFPDKENIVLEKVSDKLVYYVMEGEIVVKNTNEKILVVRIRTCFNSIISHTYVKSGNILAEDPSSLLAKKAFDNGFLGINSRDYLSNRWSDLNALLTEPTDRTALERILDSNMENFLQKLETNPSSISEDLYNIRHIIYHNY